MDGHFADAGVPIGCGRSMRNYKVAVEPILAAAGFEVTAQETLRAGHATQIVAGLAPQDYEAVVAVGGDGTVFEILQAGHPLCFLGSFCQRELVLGAHDASMPHTQG